MGRSDQNFASGGPLRLSDPNVFPNEMFERIIRKLSGDNPTLLICSRVCRLFLHLSRSEYFRSRKVILYDKTWLPSSSSKPDTLLALLTSPHETLSMYIRLIKLNASCAYKQGNSKPTMTDPDFVSVVSRIARFPKLEQLCVMALPPSVAEAFCSTSCPSLRSFYAFGVVWRFEDFARFAAMNPFLDHLSIQEWIVNLESFDSILGNECRFGNGLKSLRVCNSTATAIFQGLLSRSKHSYLKEIVLSFTRGITAWHPRQSKDDVPSISSFLRYCAPCLESLILGSDGSAVQLPLSDQLWITALCLPTTLRYFQWDIYTGSLVSYIDFSPRLSLFEIQCRAFEGWKSQSLELVVVNLHCELDQGWKFLEVFRRLGQFSGVSIELTNALQLSSCALLFQSRAQTSFKLENRRGLVRGRGRTMIDEMKGTYPSVVYVFPNEMFERIIRKLSGDNPTLLICSRVCRLFLHLSRSEYFRSRKVILYDKTWLPSSSSKPDTLLALLTSPHETLSMYIRLIKLNASCAYKEGKAKLTMIDPDFVSVVSRIARFPQLEHLCVMALPPSVAEAFCSTSCPSLRSFYAFGVIWQFEDFARFAAIHPLLDHLSIQEWIVDLESFDSILGNECRFSNRLKSLHVHNSTATAIFQGLLSRSKHSYLKEIVLSFTRGITAWHPRQSKDDVPSISSFLRYRAPCLESLILGSDGSAVQLPLSDQLWITALRLPTTLRYFQWDVYTGSLVSYVDFSALSSLFESQCQAFEGWNSQSLELVVVNLHCELGQGEKVEDLIPLDAFRTSFDRSSFPSLRKIVFDFKSPHDEKARFQLASFLKSFADWGSLVVFRSS
ncbi:hypothetical protein BT69DRAFT_1386318 [Atractiella rhizophila]|nr:hypothetical protein BT69DRAFT_1386318 [Atractiella rhizophila]